MKGIIGINDFGKYRCQGQTLSGFALIEVLLSILVLSLGVIGAAGMQLTAMRTTQQSALQTAALELAVEMADVMRANDRVMKQSDAVNPFLQVDYASSTEPAAPAVSCYGEAAHCSPEEIADFTIYEWEKRLGATLPNARALICRDASPWDSDAGSFAWACHAAAGTGQGPLVIKIGWQGKNPDGSLDRDANGQAMPGIALTVEPYVR